MNTTANSSNNGLSAAPTMQPRYQVQRGEDDTIVRVALPGVPKDLVSISFDKGVLAVKGSRRSNRPESWRVVHRELADVDFALNLRLACQVDVDRLTASYEDGILTITLPVRENAKPRLIAIN